LWFTGGKEGGEKKKARRVVEGGGKEKKKVVPRTVRSGEKEERQGPRKRKGGGRRKSTNHSKRKNHAEVTLKGEKRGEKGGKPTKKKDEAYLSCRKECPPQRDFKKEGRTHMAAFHKIRKKKREGKEDTPP